MTISVNGKDYEQEDLTPDQQKLVSLLHAAQVELQHRESCLVVLQSGLQTLQHQLITSLEDVTDEDQSDA